jgi:DNA replication protein DnaC
VEPHDSAETPPQASHSFRSLGSALSGLKPVAELSDEALLAVEFLDKPRDAIAQYRDKLLDEARDDGPMNIPRRQSARDMITRLGRILEERDELARRSVERNRPEGCWCLGLGGRGIRGLAFGSMQDTDPKHPDMHLDSFVAVEPTFAKVYCGCPEGQLRRVREDAEARAWVNGWYAQAKARDLKHRWEQSGLPPRQSIRGLDQFPQDTPERRATIEAIKAWRGNRWLYLQGSIQRGKTTLAMAIGAQALILGKTVRFSELDSLMDHLRGGFDRHESQEDLLQPFRECDFLIIDDIGTRKASPFTLQTLFKILEFRKQRLLPTVFTSNRVLEARQANEPTLGSVLLDDPDGPTDMNTNGRVHISDTETIVDLDLAERAELVARIIARMMLMCTIIDVAGPPMPRDGRQDELALEW